MNATATPTVTDIISQIDSVLTPAKESELLGTLNKIVSRIENRAFDADLGYCTAFFIPVTPILNLYAFLHLEKNDVATAFQSDWQYKATAQMYGSSFYHILLLLVELGIRQNNHGIAEKALYLILLRLWNGRKRKFIRYCDKGTMLATIEKLVRFNSLLKKYDSPILLIKNHYVSSLIKKYRNHILTDASSGLKKIFSQSWNRLDQIFAHKYELDSQKSKKVAKYGLLPLYMQAKKQGYRTKLNSIDINNLIITDDASSRYNLYRPVLKDINRTNHPTLCDLTLKSMNSISGQSYPESFLNFLHDDTMISRKVVAGIVKALHKPEYREVVGFILQYLYKRVDKDCLRGEGLEKQMNSVIFKRRNDVNSRKIKEVMEYFINKEITTVKTYKQYKTSQMNRLRKIIYYVCALNLCLTYARSNTKHTT